MAFALGYIMGALSHVRETFIDQLQAGFEAAKKEFDDV